ncbi:MAG: class I SAM-dependent methyltransferase [Bdellovibrionales bacterium]|nr:class I SAM-dependent methyltransferase [Bdellovibrionales bacterium]
MRFVPELFHLSEAEEFARYQTHENEIHDPRYREFLNRLCQPLLALLSPSAKGLDFGCGPGPALAVMLEETGKRVTLYDKYFYPELPTGDFDFITCSETAEHFRHPRLEFERLNTLLRRHGWLGLMTEQSPTDKGIFSDWYYLKDPTHLMFYTPATIQWLCDSFGWTYHQPRPNVWLLQKR